MWMHRQDKYDHASKGKETADFKVKYFVEKLDKLRAQYKDL